MGLVCSMPPLQAAQVLQPEDAELFDTMVFGGGPVGAAHWDWSGPFATLFLPASLDIGL